MLAPKELLLQQGWKRMETIQEKGGREKDEKQSKQKPISIFALK